MLITMKNILQVAEAKQCALGAFNTPNLECVIAVLSTAEKLNLPVIIQFAEVHEDLIPLKIMGPIMVALAEKSTVPVCVHLDHGTALAYLSEALKMGFTSVMYDGSGLEYHDNVANTCMAVEMASRCGASVEAEIGAIGREEGSSLGDKAGNHVGNVTGESCYTDPDQARDFVTRTKIDALACSFGTVHGIYVTKPSLDFLRLSEIRTKVNIPLVMHGGSGICADDYRECISRGIRKINYYTYMSRNGGNYVKEKCASKGSEDVYFHDVVKWGIDAMARDIMSAMKVFSGLPHGVDNVTKE
ncbi:putative fructose-bisphosphate aldolase [Peptococcaceae bacterium CEB3]|nr:putative fructose-bisphosphate aldolase [Peptococcaceae bacterium CEB3]